MASDTFDAITFPFVIGHEGKWGNDRRDRGNWTSGVIGKGELKGTKYGVAAHAYPELDIKNLTIDDARKIIDLGAVLNALRAALPRGELSDYPPNG